MDNHYTRDKTGFTIVELMIVIIVIAILAAISIVAYTGIQSRAHAVATASNVRHYVNALNIYYAENGSYYFEQDADISTEYCVGNPGEEGCYTFQYIGDSCSLQGGGAADINPGFIEAMETLVGPMPSAVQSAGTITQRVQLTEDCILQVDMRAPFYRASSHVTIRSDGRVFSAYPAGSSPRDNAQAYLIQWSLSGDANCHLASTHSMYDEQNDATTCTVVGGDVRYE